MKKAWARLFGVILATACLLSLSSCGLLPLLLLGTSDDGETSETSETGDSAKESSDVPVSSADGGEDADPEGNDGEDGESGEASDPPSASASVTEVLIGLGYSAEHAAKIEALFETLAIHEIKVFKGQGENGGPEDGEYFVICFPNGYTEENRLFFFETEYGEVLYVGVEGETMYDTEQGGFVKSYDEITPKEPEEEWTTDIPAEAELVLIRIAEDMAKQTAKNPGTVDMKELTMGFANKGNLYAVQSQFDCSNLLGVKERHTIRVLCRATEDKSSIRPYEVYLDGVLIVSQTE